MTSLKPQQSQEQTDEEFLEIKDLNNPESIIWSGSDSSNRDQIDGAGGIYDSYEYFDAPLAFSDGFEPLDLTAQNSYLGGFGADGIPNESYHVSAELWKHDDASGVSDTDPNQVFMASSASGA